MFYIQSTVVYQLALFSRSLSLVVFWILIYSHLFICSDIRIVFFCPFLLNNLLQIMRKNKNLSPAEIYFLHLQPFKVKSFFSSLSNKTFDVGPKICSRPSAVSLIERKNAHFVCAKNWMPKVNKMLYQSSPRCHLSRCHNFCVIKSVVFFDEGIRWH